MMFSGFRDTLGREPHYPRSGKPTAFWRLPLIGTAFCYESVMAGPQHLDIAAIQAAMRAFVAEREWQRFHTPKNLVMALSGEAGELTELFQWLTEEESWAIMGQPASAQAVSDEIADILLYTLRLADLLGVDLDAAVRAKMARNAAKYPPEQFKGKARNYAQE